MVSKGSLSYYMVAVAVGIAATFVWRYSEAPTVVIVNPNSEKGTKLSKLSSFVTCKGSSTATKICQFKNSCYIPEENKFVFLVTNSSSFLNVDIDQADELVELAGRPGHNDSLLKFDTVHNTIRLRKLFHNIHYSGDPVHILFRNNPNDMFYAFHDDFIPMYFTYKHLCAGDAHSCAETITLMYMDHHAHTPNARLYNFFSAFEPRKRQHLRNDTMYCFKLASAGLSKHSLWHKGEDGSAFGKAGVDEIPSSSLTGFDLEGFANFTMKRMCADHLYRFEKICSEDRCAENKDYPVIMLMRTKNRRVINEADIKLSLEKLYRFHFTHSPENPVRILSLETDHIYTIMCAIRNSKLVVAMHGDASIFSIFQPQGSAFVELFPFGIEPSYFTQIKDLSELQGRNMFYKAWVNEDPDLAVIPEEIMNRTIIVKTEEELRFHQDTIVDLSTFIPLIEKTLVNVKKYNISSTPIVLPMDVLPGHVSNLTCSRKDGKILIQFQKPWNMNNVGPGRPSYEVQNYIMRDGHKDKKVIYETSVQLDDMTPEKKLNISVNAVIGGDRAGAPNSVICQPLPLEQAQKIKVKVMNKLKSPKPKPQNPFKEKPKEQVKKDSVNREKKYGDNEQCSYH